MSLTKTLRPKTLDEIYGNKTIIKSLKAVMSQENIPDCFLFSGPKGTGKTTLARIITSMIGADNCGITEINSSNETGVKNARDIIDGLIYKPLLGEKKVYFFDEVHNTSKQFQDAMLKSMEEPPAHVYFILCTTEPNKLQPALIDRCSHFKTQPLNKSELFDMLNDICQNNQIKLKLETHEKIFQAIYEESQGGPRRAIKILEQIKDLKDITQKEVIEFIKSSENENNKNVIDLCRLLLKSNNWKDISEILKKINDDPEKMRHAILTYFSKVLLSSGSPVAAKIIENFSNNFYDSGKAGFILSCWRCVNK